MTDLHRRFRNLDRVPAPDLWSEVTHRASMPHGLWSASTMNRLAPLALAASATVAVIIGVALFMQAPARVGPPSAVQSPSASTAPSESLPAASLLPRLGMPGFSPNEPAGEYGWT